jgi:tetratricopeptide (TPR) repeat protein
VAPALTKGPARGAVFALNLEEPRKSTVITCPEAETLGNLLFHEGDLLSQNLTSVTAYFRLKDQLAAIDEVLAHKPRDTEALRERARLRLDKGDTADAVVDLRRALEGSPPRELETALRAELFVALTQLLERDFPAGEKYLDEYRALCRAPVLSTGRGQGRLLEEQRRRQTYYLALLARGQQEQGRLAEALTAYRALLDSATPNQLLPLPDDPAVQVRPDLWVQGQIAAHAVRANLAQRRLLADQVDRAWRTTREAGDPESLHRFLALFGGLSGPLAEPGREARLLLAERLADDPDRRLSLEAQLLLLELEDRGSRIAEGEPKSGTGIHSTALFPTPDARAAIHDPRSSPFRARVLLAKARLLTRNGRLEDAVHCYRQLQSDFGRVIIRDGKTGADFFNEVAADRRFLPYLDEPRKPWDGAKIKAVEIFGNFPQRGQLLPCDTADPLPPSLQEARLVIDVNEMRFKALDRDTGAERWSAELALPGMRNYLIQMGGGNGLMPYRVVGHLAVFNLGADVVGFDLLERRVRWVRRFQEETPSPNGAPVPQLDNGTNMGMYWGGWPSATWPFGPSGLCVRSVTTLMVLDPASGEVRWSRSDVPANFDVFGDNEHVYVVETGVEGAVRGIRAIRLWDGVAVPVPDCAELYPHKVRNLGRRLLVSEEGPKEERILRLYDVHTGKDLWRKTYPAHSIVIEPHVPEVTGIVTPDGAVTLFDTLTQKEILRAKVEPKHLDKVSGIRLLADRGQFYLAFQGADAAPGILGGDGTSESVMGAVRTVPISGMLYAFDRATGDLRWYSRVPRQSIIVERFEDMPLILCSAMLIRQGPPGTGNFQVIATRSIDKRTGKICYNREIVQVNELFHTFQADLTAGTVDLIATSVKIRHVLTRK